MKIKYVLIPLVVLFALTGAVAKEPAISDVIVQQRWPWSRLVDIDYVLDCDLESSVDIIVDAYKDSQRLNLPAASLSGDLYSVTYGARQIAWDPTMTDYTNNGVIPNFRVKLTPTPVPLYMIVDLTKTREDQGFIEYVYESALTNGDWGAWVRNPVTNLGTAVESVVWTGVTTNDIYKTDKLVLRRIPAGTFKMGSSLSYTTTLTKDFYTGVFQLTQRQWELLMGEKPKSDFSHSDYYQMRPVEKLNYRQIRGIETSTPPIDWPQTGALVLPASFLGVLRTKTGFPDFDLPTEAQWEYACRAGTTTIFNDGNASADVDGENANSNIWLNALGRYISNGGYLDGVTRPLPLRECGLEAGTSPVGLYVPNAWGLYDMHGNVCEWCLDWKADSLEGGVDPKGPETGTRRLKRGGTWSSFALDCLSSGPRFSSAWDDIWNVGFRVVRNLP